MPRDDNEERREVAPEEVASSAGAPGQEGPEGVDPITEAVRGPATEAPPGFNIRRRGYLAAAALGSAAAALLGRSSEGGGPMAAFAHPPIDENCTAGDIGVVSSRILNEPCDCTQPFPAVVEVIVANDTQARRHCITLHLSPTGQDVRLFLGRLPNGQPDPSSGSTLDGRGLFTMYGSLGLLPCNSPVLSFPNSIISFNPSAQNPCPTEGRINPAQCRRQDLTFVGFGISAVCANGSCVERGLTGTPPCCQVDCGESLNVKITFQGETGDLCPPGSSTLSVQRPGATGFTPITLTNGCYVDPSPVQGTYTFRVTDCHGCSRDTTLAVCVVQIDQPTVVAGTPGCAGETTFTVTPCPPDAGPPPVTYTLERVDCTTGAVIPWPTPPVPGMGCTFTVTLPLGTTVCVRVKASNGNAACDVFSPTISVVVPAQVTVDLDVAGEEACNSGQLTFTATPSGGVGPYTVTFKKDGVVIPSTGNTAIVGPTLANGGLDTACHRITVEVQDSRTCPATPASDSITYRQCVTTTLDCPLP